MKELFCTFEINGLYFGIEVGQVQEVIQSRETEPVPLASPEIRGLINLRGQIVTALDLRMRLGIEQRHDGKEPMHVVVRTDDGLVSLLVDEIGDVIEVDDESFESAPESLQGISRDLLLGAYKLENRLLLVLNIDHAVDLSLAA